MFYFKDKKIILWYRDGLKIKCNIEVFKVMQQINIKYKNKIKMVEPVVVQL
jgi:hypothetical protein